MKRIVLFDTSVGSLNQGDNIIMKAVRDNMSSILKNNFVITLPTHTPCFYPFQGKEENKRFNLFSNADYKFICGTNMINYQMKERFPNWNTYSWNCNEYANSILLGVGNTGVKDDLEVSKDTKKVLSKILSKEYIHSTRDEKTKKIIEKLGYKALNTGCPTTWYLTPDFCEKINTEKKPNAVFTLTDYLQDEIYDQKLIDGLNSNYEKVYFWPQGSGDYEYFCSLKNTDNIIVISPDIFSYKDVLNNGDVDYIGTRLHAGIFAMQHKVRAFILGVDNRALDMATTFGINCIARSELDKLEEIVNKKHITAVNIHLNEINQWKAQFDR
ncbi:polysaccharide pyruvyl transferase family protein [Butyrivibrio sp. XPD2002]|uniref:polysaccharide pyruvyl transferase family protein n=1 Tax=Butyrivibrio sp. XPD2002 TaxID=1280665 RepID=UPI0003FCDC71|nr:polysaccharide pyruvyl transferase family protein [Butyrivibrio sp. XPD2002]